jgi:prolyl oligopeptidase
VLVLGVCGGVGIENADIIPCVSVCREYGDDWHKGGIYEKKQNVFDDFIAGAEFLIEKKYCSANK